MEKLGDYDALRLQALERLSLKDDAADDVLNVTEETAETNSDDGGDLYDSCDETEDVEYGDIEEDEYLPVIVLDEMFDRKECGEEGPAKVEVVQALRTHFQSARFDDFTIYSHGSFIKCMQDIGAKPSAKDPLVYDQA